MKYMRFFIVAPILSVFLLGCSGSAPYVYKSGEFNRLPLGAVHKPKDVNSAIVCYSKNSTTPQIVSGLAMNECAKYDKFAVYDHQDYLLCPILTPVAAYFKCVPTKNVHK